MSTALAGRFLISGPSGKSNTLLSFHHRLHQELIPTQETTFLCPSIRNHSSFTKVFFHEIAAIQSHLQAPLLTLVLLIFSLHLQWLPPPCHESQNRPRISITLILNLLAFTTFIMSFTLVDGSKATSQVTRPKVFRQIDKLVWVYTLSLIHLSLPPCFALSWSQTLVLLFFVPNLNLGI